MKLTVLGTGSAGNTYILDGDEECLILDAGISFGEVKKALRFNIKRISGLIVTHSHGDHSKYIYEYQRFGIPVFMPFKDENLRQSIHLGGFTVQSFDLVHDVPCCGYLIGHPEMGRLLYVTDTEYVKYTFSSVDHMLIEANYSGDLSSKAPNWKHVLEGHMALETTLDCIRANASDALKTVTLCHLSDRNSNEKLFRAATERVVDPSVRVAVASKGLTVDLSEIPI